MFKLVSERVAWIDVKWPGLSEDGVTVENKIECQIVLVDMDDVGSLTDLGGDDKLGVFKRFVRDWRGVADEAGRSLPMTDENIEAMIRVPMFLLGFATSYGEAYQGQSDRRSLSAASPADGPPVEAVAAKVAPSKSKPARSA